MRHPARVFFYQHLVDPKSGYERIESQYPNGRPPSPKPSSIERASGQPSTNQRSLSPPPMGRQIHNQDSKAQHLNGDHATNRYPSGQLPLPPPLSTCPNYFSPAGPLLPPPHPFWQLPCPQESSQPAPDRASYRALYEPKSYWQDSNNFNPLATRTHLQRRRRGNLPREAVTILRQWYAYPPSLSPSLFDIFLEFVAPDFTPTTSLRPPARNHGHHQMLIFPTIGTRLIRITHTQTMKKRTSSSIGLALPSIKSTIGSSMPDAASPRKEPGGETRELILPRVRELKR